MILFNNIPENEKHVDINENKEMIKCFLNLPLIKKMSNPISLQEIQNYQNVDHELLQLAALEPA